MFRNKYMNGVLIYYRSTGYWVSYRKPDAQVARVLMKFAAGHHNYYYRK